MNINGIKSKLTSKVTLNISVMISFSQVGRSTFWTACGNFLFNGTDGSCGAVGVTESGRVTCFGFTCTGPVAGADGSGAGEDPEAVEASDNAAVDRPV